MKIHINYNTKLNLKSWIISIIMYNLNIACH